MELQNQLKALGEKIEQLKEKIHTEESTKHAFVLPFIASLGYDTFNPLEVIPEYTADIGLKKGEKVDYAIFQKGEPILIIECKHWKEDLNVHNSQLFRYFHTTKTRFALLTNGIEFRFYTDLENANKMDEKPFLEFNICDVKEATINEIAKFHKSNFDVDTILTNASSLKYIKELKYQFNEELKSPSPGFVRLLTSKVYSGRITEKVMTEFQELVQKAASQTISERVNDRLNSALNKELEIRQQEEIDTEPVSKIVTTEEESEAFKIVVAILRRKIPVERIAMRDTQSYCGVLLDDNNRKPLCRFHFNGTTKYLGTFNMEKKETRHPLESLEQIYDFQSVLLVSADNYAEMQ
ncbi:restriction endonuclease [Phaeocystidibacter marisrubri]|uniref:Restriction endonuclease n=2 Tax=Phaeocystidibacter marisrubri TaxID=1577780 RepID=A0A6L3ZHG2_9FLAO|nr:restriction endonuclease [Phaeocystidibacter marisrubri]